MQFQDTLSSPCAKRIYELHHEEVWENGCLDPCYPDLDTSCRRVVSFKPRQFYPQGKNPGTNYKEGWVEHRASVDDVKKIFDLSWTRNPTPLGGYY
jgi:hypothetical protein